MAKRTTTTTLNVEVFRATLPDIFNKAPDYTIDLPGGRKAEIHKTQEFSRNNQGGEFIDCFKVRLRTTSGVIAECEYPRICYTAFEVQVLLESYAYRFSKKTSITVEEDDPNGV